MTAALKEPLVTLRRLDFLLCKTAEAVTAIAEVVPESVERGEAVRLEVDVTAVDKTALGHLDAGIREPGVDDALVERTGDEGVRPGVDVHSRFAGLVVGLSELVDRGASGDALGLP